MTAVWIAGDVLRLVAGVSMFFGGLCLLIHTMESVRTTMREIDNGAVLVGLGAVLMPVGLILASTAFE